MNEQIDWSKFEQNESEYITFSPNEEKALVFKDGVITARETVITFEGIEKAVPALHLEAILEDGKATDKKLTVTSKRLAQQLKPYIVDGSIFKNEFGVTKTGAGYQTNYIVRVLRGLEV